ncbi:MAG: hypothetical protein ACNA7H_00135 [Desulfotignum sp.]
MVTLRFIITGILLAGAAMGFACMGSYGRLVTSPVTLDQYQQPALPADLHYYYCGRAGLPDAVVGLTGTYVFNDRLWFRIDTMEAVYEKIRNLSDLHPDATTMRVADILDPGGEWIGLWFSYYHHTPVRVDPRTGVLDIFSPYDPNEDEGGMVWR